MVKMKNSNFKEVKTFMETFKQKVRTEPQWHTDEEVDLRIDLIREELNELEEACEKGTLVDVADALTDILYVTYGAGHTFGIDLDKCFAEVQRSNMSKLGEDGKPMYRKDGKVMKGPNYSEPNLEGVIYDE